MNAASPQPAADWGDGYNYVHLVYCVGCRASWIGENDGDCACSCIDGQADYERWLTFEVPNRDCD